MIGKKALIGVVGSGAMGSGIAQVAATAGHEVVIYDNNGDALKKSESGLKNILNKLAEKQKISASEADAIIKRVKYASVLEKLKDCDLIIEAIVENIAVKKEVFQKLENIVQPDCVLATNTSSLSITLIASACKDPSRVIGIHFFNPAPLMPLVEIIPGLATNGKLVNECKKLMDGWGKTSVVAKDTPGFIVNRVARPFYSEALRILDEGLADIATIDHAMRELGKFKMGPFELMDLIGHDVNYVVTETVWREMYFDPRYKPSLSQKRLLDAGFLGRKTGRGFYNYAEGAEMPAPKKDRNLLQKIFRRILTMLVNEAAEGLYMGIATAQDIDLAMTKGVNYPKGLLQWGDELGLPAIVEEMDWLRTRYQEDRYRICPLLKQRASHGGGLSA